MTRKRWLGLGAVVALLLAAMALLGGKSYSLEPLAGYRGALQSRNVSFYQGPTQRWQVENWVLETDDLQTVGEMIESRFSQADGWQRVKYSNGVGLQKEIGGQLFEVSYGIDPPGKVWVQEIRPLSTKDYVLRWLRSRGHVKFETATADRSLGQ